MRRLILLLLTILIATSAAAADHGAILIYSGTTGYRHESIPAGIAAVTAIARKRGLSVEASEDPNVFSADTLKRFRAIVLLSCTTDPKNPASEWLTGSRREALQQFVHRGGGILAIHAAADSHYHWPWYGKMIGGHFARHPQGTPTGTIRMLATGETRSRTDEWYYFDDWDPTSHLLVTLDPQSIGEADVNPNPMTWTRKVEGGRVFYTAMGHTTENYSEPWFLDQLAEGLDWVLGGK
jgi:type 1 glutamine amidotransferase